MSPPRELRFSKLHGAANDYICLDGALCAGQDLPTLARRLCDRRRGIGADGLLVLMNSQCADYRMLIYNADGSRPEMCGNGLRCLVKFALDRESDPRRESVRVETDAGVLAVEAFRGEGGLVIAARIDLGVPRWSRAEVPIDGPPDSEALEEELSIDGTPWTVSAVSFGNPHAVVRVQDVDAVPIERVGPALERHPTFPRGTNVEFVTTIDRRSIRQRTWERGVGETLACGTGAAAVAVVAARLDWCDRSVDIELRGGHLQVEWSEDDHVRLTGPAEQVFEGILTEGMALGE